FYETVFGWKATVNPGYTEFSLGGDTFAGQMQMDENFPATIPSNWLPYILVPDVDASSARVTELGGKLNMGPQDIPGTGRISVLADPQGAVLGLYQKGS